MTGYGQMSAGSGDGTISIEVKSLNSKFLDLSLRLPKKFIEIVVQSSKKNRHHQ